MVVGTDWTGLSQTGWAKQKVSDKGCIGWRLIRSKIAKIAAEQKLLSALKKFTFNPFYLPP